jgi:hypothetical protein
MVQVADSTIGLKVQIKQPDDFGTELDFPEHPATLTSDDVATWMFRLTGWQSYVLSQMSEVDFRQVRARYRYQRKYRQVVGTIDNAYRRSTETLHAEAIALDIEIQQLLDIVHGIELEFMKWKYFKEILEIQLVALSREITRRTQEAKLNVG